MEVKLDRKDGLFFLVCLGLGVLAEICFLHGRIGVSFLVFIVGFYAVLFTKFGLDFNHRRIGLLFMASIWILSGTFLFFDSTLFNTLNILVIPILIFAHIVLITSPSTFKWNTPRFITMLTEKLKAAVRFNLNISKNYSAFIKKDMNRRMSETGKRIIVGIAISIPLLAIVTVLLMSADDVFKKLVLYLPEIILNVSITEIIFRPIFVLLFTFCFFSIFQVLKSPTEKRIIKPQEQERQQSHIPSVTVVTVLTMLIFVYLLFVIIQFQYFFDSEMLEEMTYATYARKGFAELLVVMLINWTILIVCLKLVNEKRKKMKWALNLYYSLLIIMSGVMLASAYQRLSLYEAAYGYTMDRVLAHAFMIFLIVIFAYTFIRVWMERISILHFYLIMGLIFYTVLNIINLEQIIVDENLKRFEATGKIDIHYLQSLSYTGIDGLIQLYGQGESVEENKEIERILAIELDKINNEPKPNWQAYNFVRQDVQTKLKEIDIDEQIINEVHESSELYNY